MKVVLFTCVVALVAGQPLFFVQTPSQYAQGICSGFLQKTDAQCCIDPGFHRGRCDRVPGSFNNYGLPPPQFLTEVCCEFGSRCCMKDSSNLMFPSYNCCPQATHNCVVTDGKGECVELVNQTQGVPPLFVAELDRLGRCPDGLPPITHEPNVPFICSSASLVNGAWGASTCPTDTYCAKDRSTNQNTGVCCRDSHCTNYRDCQTCVRTEEHTFEPKDAPCSWLTQGDGIGGTLIPNSYDNVTDTVEKNLVGGRCVATCDTFPEKSCILPHASGLLCPKTINWVNGTDYNVGSCARRCGNVGTGRSSRINQGMEAHITPSTEATPCCKNQPNDYCCAWDGTLADHCGTGRVKGGPVCGVPISGTPNNFFNTPQIGFGYPGMGMPMGFGYPGMGFGYPGMGFGFPGMGFGYPGMGFGFGGPMMYNAPMMYRNYAETAEMETEDAQKAAQAENDKMFFFPPMGPSFYRPAVRPLPPPPPPPAPVDQQPSDEVCSCDDDCVKDENADCCKDYYQTCGFGDKYGISLAEVATFYPAWWIYDGPNFPLSRSNRS